MAQVSPIFTDTRSIRLAPADVRQLVILGAGLERTAFGPSQGQVIGQFWRSTTP